jgi:AbrB family looped-hinge helix DNA binding protein
MKNNTVSPKGQVVIPAEYRRKLGLKPGMQVHFIQREEGELTLVPHTSAIAAKLKGFLKDDQDTLSKVYQEYKREELRVEKA